MTKPTVCVVGPLVSGHGRVITQGEKLRDVLVSAGYPVIAVSTSNSRLGRLTEIAATLVRERRRIDVVVVFTYGFKSYVIEDMATALARRFGIPIVMSLCGGALPSFIDRFPSWSSRVFRRADRIVCQSPYLSRTMARAGFEAEIIPNVFDVSRYRYKHRSSVRPKLFWMRTFEKVYNPELALRTLQRVRAYHIDASLVLAGEDTGYRKVVEGQARDMKLDDAVRFAGFLDLEGKQREGDAADIFLNTPRIDNRPICVVEAAALGLPVVTTDVGGIPDLVEHEATAMLVPDDDDRAMAAAISRLVGEPSLAERLSRNGTELAKLSAIENVLPQWSRLLGTVVS